MHHLAQRTPAPPPLTRSYDVTLSTRYGPLDMRTFHIEPGEADDERALSNKVRAWLETTSLDAGDTITIEKAHAG